MLNYIQYSSKYILTITEQDIDPSDEVDGAQNDEVVVTDWRSNAVFVMIVMEALDQPIDCQERLI